jgi:hypothetical protein
MNIISFTAEYDSELSYRNHFKEEQDKISVIYKRCSHQEFY